MTTNHKIAVSALLLFLFRGIVCTSTGMCSPYKMLENQANARTTIKREDAERKILAGHDLVVILNDLCRVLNREVLEITQGCRIPNMLKNEICDGPVTSWYLFGEWRDLQKPWTMSAICSNMTRQLRDECFKRKRTTTELFNLFNGPQHVIGRMNDAWMTCEKQPYLSFLESYCVGWQLYLRVSEFLVRFHPGVRFSSSDGYY